MAFAANLPNGEACYPDGSGRIFALSFGTGRSVLVDVKGELVESIATTRTVRDLAFTRVQGRVRLYGGDRDGKLTKVPAELGDSGTLRQIGWREVPATQ